MDINNLIDRSGLLYAPNKEKPFSGSVFALYDNGQKKLNGRYRKGLMNGLWKYYYENGQIRYQGSFVNGDGSYPDNYSDSLKLKYPPFGGRKSRWTGWYENGQKKEEGTYKDGFRHGNWTYYTDGVELWGEIPHGHYKRYKAHATNHLEKKKVAKV